MAKSNKIINKVPSQGSQGSRLRDLDVNDVEKLFNLGLVPGFNMKGHIVPSEVPFLFGSFRDHLRTMSSRFFVPIVKDDTITLSEQPITVCPITVYTYKLQVDLYCERQRRVLKSGSVVYHLFWKMSNFPYVMTDDNCNMIASNFETMDAPINVNFVHPVLGEVTIAHCYEALQYFKGIVSCKK